MKTEKYAEQLKRLPREGKHVIAQIQNNEIVVYQAFNINIAKYAVENQQFGGPHYSFNRMSWIKSGFLWMMYRAGWATKDHQQAILAITIDRKHFYEILSNCCISSYDPAIYKTEADWKRALSETEVRLQWDPDHDPNGIKQNRKAIQLGLKGEMQRKFCTEWIIKIEDITTFVHHQFNNMQEQGIDSLEVPYEECIEIESLEINARIGIDRVTRLS
jgi:hypothetical protein